MVCRWKRSLNLENKEYIRQDRIRIEQRLRDLLPDTDELTQSMRYSLLAGGKRLRPVLAMEFCRASGADPEVALDAACALEMLHTYTLIHDDLPCMDNDDLRRGKPTNHVVYGEWLAMLAGDALQAEAFSVILQSKLSDRQKVTAAALLAEAAGICGVCKGQYLDLNAEGKQLSITELDALNAGKTGALFAAACAIGCVCAGKFELIENAKQFGDLFGAAFQIRDDILDEVSTPEELGKPIGSDHRNGKNTMLSLLGMQACETQIREKSEQAISILKNKFPYPDSLVWLTEEMICRKS